MHTKHSSIPFFLRLIIFRRRPQMDLLGFLGHSVDIDRSHLDGPCRRSLDGHTLRVLLLVFWRYTIEPQYPVR